MPELTSPHPIGEHAPQQSDLPAPPRAHALTLENRARLYQVRGLQDLFAFVPRPGGYAQRFRVERGQLAQAAVFEEGPHVRAQTFERFLALAGCIGFVHNFLHVLFCQ